MRAWVSILTLLLALLSGCTNNPGGKASQPDPYRPVPYIKLKHPEWSKNATIYQINTRQFAPEGTFRAAEQQLPRLKELGGAILAVGRLDGTAPRGFAATIGLAGWPRCQTG